MKLLVAERSFFSFLLFGKKVIVKDIRQHRLVFSQRNRNGWHVVQIGWLWIGWAELR